VHGFAARLGIFDALKNCETHCCREIECACELRLSDMIISFTRLRSEQMTAFIYRSKTHLLKVWTCDYAWVPQALLLCSFLPRLIIGSFQITRRGISAKER
jgi:hypothetical protein